MEKYQSLFDFLGKPAGKELGRNVYLLSKINKIRPIIREIEEPNYKGKVMTYPNSFLEKYKPVIGINRNIK